MNENIRPVRLNENIRSWADESQHGKYGDEALGWYAVELDDIPGINELSPVKKQDAAIRRIAERAPVRICEYEKVSGSATLGLAIRHKIPATLGGKPLQESVSHHTANFIRTLKKGVSDYERQVNERLADASLDEKQREFIESLSSLIASMHIWHARYLEATRESKPEIHEMLKQVPFEPARNFREAVQSLWFTFAFMRQCGNWPGIGRIDLMLGDYLKKDLADGSITIEEAREVLASMFIKGCEWIESDTKPGSGDAQHYQNIVLAGIDEDGNEVTNEVTYLVLDIVEELNISDFPITVRINENTPEKLIRRVAEVMRFGGGVVAVYNEPLIIRALENAGYDPIISRRFANDGCWEVQIPGETNFGYLPFDALKILGDVLGVYGEGDIPAYASFEELYSAFLEGLKAHVGRQFENCVTNAYECRGGAWVCPGSIPCSMVSLFTDGCIENARSYYDLGAVYNVRSPHIGGAPDVGNSLYAIDRMVFTEKRMSLEKLVKALRDNWEGMEAERLHAHNKYTYYGNDDDTADAYTVRVLNDFADIVTGFVSDVPMKFVPGVSTFGRQIEWLPQRAATAFGARKGDILSGNSSPTPGTDMSGATSIIRSYCKADLVKQTTGAALDVKLYPDTVAGENGINAIMALIRGFAALGGYFMQLDVVDAEILRAAQQDPQAYKTLSVRVSGWNARFVTLDKEWQNMIIERTAQHV